MSRAFNFNAGPAVLPVEVLEEAQSELLDYKGTGMSLLESSHRGKEYDEVHQEAIDNYTKLLNCSDDFAVLFIAGGASLQFAMIPMNLLGTGQTADYTNSGSWAGKAIKEAQLVGNVNVAADCAGEIPTRVPSEQELNLTPDAAYVHITSNETISGAQWKTFPETKAPLVADMSSDILSRPFDINRFGLIYAGAQKNLGPSGVALVAIRKDLAERASDNIPAMLKYRTFIEKKSLYNTPPTFTIYIMMLVSRWIMKVGLSTLHKLNVEKAARIYAAIDSSGFYKGTAKPECRSDMNITFRLAAEALEKQFIKEAAKQGLKSLKGHRSVGGLRASVYNAFPMEGVDALVSFMKDFEKKNG